MRTWAARQVAKQQNLCPLCNSFLDLRIKGEGVIDHDHDTGEVRGVLHRSCNAAEGKISNAAGQWGAKSSDYADIIAFVERYLAYLKGPKCGVIYALHQTSEEKKVKKNDKATKVRRERKAVAAAAIAARRVSPPKD
jgi:hypothetical protein